MMIGYLCKYTPIELFESMGVETTQIKPSNTSTIHNTICSYTKAILESVLINDYDGIILTSCCSSHIELYILLKYRFPDKYIYLLDLPKETDGTSAVFFRNQILAMIKSYECFSGRRFDETILKNMLKACKPNPYFKPINIGILADQCSQGLPNSLEDNAINVLFDFTCSLHHRDVRVYANNILLDYTYKLLKQFPCMHMADSRNRKYYLDKYKYYLSGILYTTIKSCNSYSQDFNTIKESLSVPILKLETDYSSVCETENKNKMQHFIETLKPKEYCYTNI
jgi:benzoyl-CoA reductase/2-hydroxyglutaryl-CoA dehydratase subunit BcrC/BadD/HgdB